MDGRRFDDLARALARPSSRRGALAALAGLLPIAAVPIAASAKRRRGCRPTCGAGFVCRNRQCVCESGVPCGGACCAAWQSCAAGVCVTPDPPPACIEPGAPCKDIGLPCCDGRTCASGQGGQDDVACHVPAGEACSSTADCVYGAECRGGRCVDTTPRCTVCPAGCPHTTIEGAVADSRYPVVTVAAGLYLPVPEVADEGARRLVIRRSVSVEACGDGPVLIDGDCLGGVVEIAAGPGGPPAVTLRNLAIANGIDDHGGGIRIAAGSLVLDGVIVQDSNAGSDGGGVHVGPGASLTIAGASEITRNEASSGGGIHCADGSAVVIGGTARIHDNRAAGEGGGVYKRRLARLTIRDRATITGNVADVAGGVYSDPCDQPVPTECANQASVCGNTANVAAPECGGEFGTSCLPVCCTITPQSRGRGEVGVALC